MLICCICFLSFFLQRPFHPFWRCRDFEPRSNFSRNVCGIIVKCKCLEATGTQTTESYRAWLLTPEVRKSCQRSADSITALKTSSGFNISTKAVCWELHGMGSSCKCPGTFVHVTVSVQLTLVSCEVLFLASPQL